MPSSVKHTRSDGDCSVTINWDEVDELLRAGCPGTEIASAIGCHYDTLYRHTIKEKGASFADYSASVKSCGEANIRKQYYQRALKGNTQLLLSLGRERLGYGSGESAGQDQGRAIISLLKEIEQLKSILQSRGFDLSVLENEQSLLYQGQGRESDQIPNELGAKGIVE